MFLTANMSCCSSVFDVNVGYIENDNFNKFRSFSVFSNISVRTGIHVNVDNYLNHRFYIQNLLQNQIFLTLFLMFNVKKYSSNLEAYDSIKTYSQFLFFTYESINICEYVETSCLYSNLISGQFLNFSTGT